ncbi:MAG: exodeoxyribonuclease VII small subunit [Bacillota bacterium]|nr:exodeoxyribonuclease VII small subunit [Bacillota bacterium]MDD3298685.1 exodeoxyribonuclease VII small subunit [Bacillota bacterium]MDD3850532.1 exodeoxyribonuclease VII small subunit [Bacillota bacterium]MDD4707662.1 exodeoxyribonuclease VII small subunit [Bacillota bacterium]
MERELSFEEAMDRMEEIVALLEDGELALDKSLEVFEEGIRLYRYLTKKLEKVEGRVRIIMEDQDGAVEKTDLKMKGDRDLGF